MYWSHIGTEFSTVYQIWRDLTYSRYCCVLQNFNVILVKFNMNKELNLSRVPLFFTHFWTESFKIDVSFRDVEKRDLFEYGSFRHFPLGCNAYITTVDAHIHALRLAYYMSGAATGIHFRCESTTKGYVVMFSGWPSDAPVSSKTLLCDRAESLL